MVFGASINPKKSLLISLLSGVGLLAVVGIAPTKDEIHPEDSEAYIESFNESEPGSQSTGFRRAIEKRSQRKNESTPSLLNLRMKPEEWKEMGEDFRLKSERLGNWDQPFSKLMKVKNFASERMFAPGREFYSRSMNWENENISVQSAHTFQPERFNFQENNAINPFRSRRIHTANLDYLDIDIPISQSVSAVFTTSSGDVFDDRRMEGRSRNFALAGISLNKGDLISTRFVAGDSNLQLHRQGRNPGYFGATNAQSFRELGFSEREASQMRSFEWQTNIKPTKSVRLQTALYNNPQAGIESNDRSRSNIPDSGRMSLFLGERRVIMNVKYDYQMSQASLREMMNQWQPKQDSASLGFIFFLDPAQKYSVYVGGNQFNVTDRVQNNNRNTSEPVPASFTASFRGKTYGQSDSSFFVNFQNQPPGAWGLGMPNRLAEQNQSNFGSKSFYEYATTLGLEVNF